MTLSAAPLQFPCASVGWQSRTWLVSVCLRVNGSLCTPLGVRKSCLLFTSTCLRAVGRATPSQLHDNRMAERYPVHESFTYTNVSTISTLRSRLGLGAFIDLSFAAVRQTLHDTCRAAHGALARWPRSWPARFPRCTRSGWKCRTSRHSSAGNGRSTSTCGGW